MPDFNLQCSGHKGSVSDELSCVYCDKNEFQENIHRTVVLYGQRFWAGFWQMWCLWNEQRPCPECWYMFWPWSTSCW